MRLLLKHPLITLLSVFIVAALIWGFWPQPILVETTTVTRAPLTVSIEEEGRTRVIDRYVISAPVDGVTCRMDLNVGDSVQQSQVLLNITPLESQVLDPRSRAQAEARVSAAQASLEASKHEAQAAKASADFHRTEVERLRPLATAGVISRDALDRAELQVLTSDAALRAADHAVEVAQYNLEAAKTALQYSAGTVTTEPAERVPVHSPIDGKILKLSQQCERPVRTGEVLLEIGDPSLLEVEVDVLSADAVKIQAGTRVLFDRWGGEQPLEGVVRTVEPVGFTKISALGVEEQRVLIIADFTSPTERWQRLGDGYRVEASFILWHDDDVLQVPASSLFRVDNGWAVFVMENNRATRRMVKVGQRNGLVAQILEKLQAGELVINHPADDVEEGRRVKSR